MKIRNIASTVILSLIPDAIIVDLLFVHGRLEKEAKTSISLLITRARQALQIRRFFYDAYRNQLTALYKIGEQAIPAAVCFQEKA